jgi:hypothetical protein
MYQSVIFRAVAGLEKKLPESLEKRALLRFEEA